MIYHWKDNLKRHVETRTTYIDILPSLDLLDAFADVLKGVLGVLEEVVHSFAHSLRVPASAEQVDLVGQAGDVAGEGKELGHEVLRQDLELWIVGILRIILSSQRSATL